jgi:arabinose-5-phosphate isomerase
VRSPLVDAVAIWASSPMVICAGWSRKGGPARIGCPRGDASRTPAPLAAHALAVDAAQLMEQHRITSVLVVDDRGNLCGALNSNDLMRAKVI